MTQYTDTKPETLADFGWTPFFQAQLDVETLENSMPVRVMAVHRAALDVACPGLYMRIAAIRTDDDDARATVGDWLLVDRATGRATTLLERQSLFRRKAAGTERRTQLIAANLDTLIVVSSCNQDFNQARLERYLALAYEAGVMPMIVLTKADLTDDAGAYATQAAALSPGLLVETLDAREPASVTCLEPWCGPGQTVALVGSSGVGKSTLVNSLALGDEQSTGSIREDDAKGRHTTSGRSMHRLAAGGWIVDTPGMRELQLTDVESGIADIFADVTTLAAACRFNDCGHDSEPGCAVQASIEAGDLDPGRLRRYRKLMAEDAHNARTLAERHALERGFGRKIKGIMREKRRRQGD